jgi:hypothetical protein
VIRIKRLTTLGEEVRYKVMHVRIVSRLDIRRNTSVGESEVTEDIRIITDLTMTQENWMSARDGAAQWRRVRRKEGNTTVCVLRRVSVRNSRTLESMSVIMVTK